MSASRFVHSPDGVRVRRIPRRVEPVRAPSPALSLAHVDARPCADGRSCDWLPGEGRQHDLRPRPTSEVGISLSTCRSTTSSAWARPLGEESGSPSAAPMVESSTRGSRAGRPRWRRREVSRRADGTGTSVRPAIIDRRCRPPISSSSPGHASTTSRTSRSRCRATRSWSSPACPARASRRSPSTRSTPRASAATSSRCRPTRASSSGRWTSPTSTRSRGSRRRSRSTRRRPRATRARRSAPSPRSTTTCACCGRASAIRTARDAAERSPGSRPSRSSTR